MKNYNFLHVGTDSWKLNVDRKMGWRCQKWVCLL